MWSDRLQPLPADHVPFIVASTQPGRSGETGEALGSLRTFYKLQSCLGRGRIAIHPVCDGTFLPNLLLKGNSEATLPDKGLGDKPENIGLGSFCALGWNCFANSSGILLELSSAGSQGRGAWRSQHFSGLPTSLNCSVS